MKKWCLLLISIMVIVLPGCGKIIGNNALGSIGNEECEITLSVDTGGTIETYTLDDKSEKSNVIAYCNSMEHEIEDTKEVTVSEEAVEYEIKVSYPDGTEKCVILKEGYLFTEEGKVYEAADDFSVILSIYRWRKIE